MDKANEFPSASRNLCTKIFSYDDYHDNEAIAFESNIESVICHDNFARSIAEMRSTAVTNCIFKRDRPMYIKVDISACMMEKPLVIGIVTNNAPFHQCRVIGDTDFVSMGLKVAYSLNDGKSQNLVMRTNFLRTLMKNEHFIDKAEDFASEKDQSVKKYDSVSIEYDGQDFTFYVNDKFAFSSPNELVSKSFRIGVSFLSSRQEVCISAVNSNRKPTQSPFEKKKIISLPQNPALSQAWTFVSPWHNLLISGESILCMRDTVCTAVTAEIFQALTWDHTQCRSCGSQPIKTNQWRCTTCAEFSLCQRCFIALRSVHNNLPSHQHPVDHFRCVLGGESHRIAFRIDDLDDGMHPMFFGIVPKMQALEKRPVGLEPGSIGIQIGKSLKFLNMGVQSTLPIECSLQLGDILHLVITEKAIQFFLNDLLITTSSIPCAQYRFAVSLVRTNHAVSTVSGNFAQKVPRGALVHISDDHADMEKHAKECGIQPSHEMLGLTGTAVEEDESDGTVGVHSDHAFKWVPRLCCEIRKCPRQQTRSFRQALAIPYAGDTVIVHPCSTAGLKVPNGGLSGTTRRGFITQASRGHEAVQYAIDMNQSHGSDEKMWANFVLSHESLDLLLLKLEQDCQVIRNPYFWRWGCQDGRTFQSIEEICYHFGWVVAFPKNGWVTVFWRVSGVCENYRFGFDNAFDVACIRRPSDTGFYLPKFPDIVREPKCRNTDLHSTFIKECHFVPMHELQFSRSSEIGRGRFGTVYKGTLGDVDVAIKHISHPDAHQARDLGVLSRILHPNAVKILGWSASDNDGMEIYLIMELVTPGSLAKLLADHPCQEASSGGPLGWNNFFDVSIGVAHALHYFNRQSLVHRDIKPENILLEGVSGDYIVRVTDFGLAKFVRRTGSADLTNVCGTPAYMSPEAWDTDCTLCPKADVFSLGLVMHFMLTGIAPRSKCENAFQILYDLVTLKNIVVPPPGTPGRLTTLIIRCQSLSPSERPDAMEIIRELFRLKQDLGMAPMYLESPISKKGSPVVPALASLDRKNPSKALAIAPRGVRMNQDQISTDRELIAAGPGSMQRISLRDLTHGLGFTSDSASILLLEPEVAGLALPQADAQFSLEKHRLVLHTAVDQFLIGVKVIVLQTKLTLEELFACITKANIPILVKAPSKGLKVYYVLLRHYAKIINIVSNRRLFTRAPVRIPQMQGRYVPRSGKAVQNKNHNEGSFLALADNKHGETTTVEKSSFPATFPKNQIRVVNPGMQKMQRTRLMTVKYLSFKNFCEFADITIASLITLINHKFIRPKHIFGQTYRISCDQKEKLEDGILAIDKFQASCSLSASEIRAFALLLNVPVLYRPKAKMFYLLYDDVYDRIMPVIEHTSTISNRKDFISFLSLSITDANALEKRGALLQSLCFKNARIFEHVARIMQLLVPLAIARQEIQHMLDLSSEEFDGMLDDFIERYNMHGRVQVKGSVYLLREEIQVLMQEFSEFE